MAATATATADAADATAAEAPEDSSRPPQSAESYCPGQLIGPAWM